MLHHRMAPKVPSKFWKGIKTAIPLSFVIWLVIGCIVWYVRTR